MKTHANMVILFLLLLMLSACARAFQPAISTSTHVPTALPTPTIQPTRISAYSIYPPDRTLPWKQEIIKNSQHSIEQWQRIEAWADYWIKCDNPPLNPASKTHWDLIFDNPDDPTESFMVIESEEAYYATPFSYYGVWLDPPYTACHGVLDPAYAPVLLATGEDRKSLKMQGGKIVQIDEQGSIVANIEPQGLPSPEDFNINEFHNLPPSYEYLLAHRGEFVQAPDPISERGGFDRWFAEKLVPALGPLSEREVNLQSLSAGPDGYGYGFYMWPILPTVGQPTFFYFESSGIVFPVPCLNISINDNHEGVDWTLCVAMFNGPSFPSIENELAGLAEGRELNQGQIYKDFRFRSDLDYGDQVELMIDSIGDYTLGANNIGFGMGFIMVIPKK